ncbi:MAG: YkgJ family cysteine cluster protein [Bilophila sp.]
MSSVKQVFDCQMCGQCCEGEGGIVLSPRDLQRLCQGLGLEQDAFLATYAVFRNGKNQVRTGEDGKCIFFREGTGCSVDVDKPDVCRAWPFFRGNMVDAESLYLAKDYCPGIRADATHAEFVAEGRAYLAEYGLEAADPRCEGHALLPASFCLSSTKDTPGDAGQA